MLFNKVDGVDLIEAFKRASHFADFSYDAPFTALSMSDKFPVSGYTIYNLLTLYWPYRNNGGYFDDLDDYAQEIDAVFLWSNEINRICDGVKVGDKPDIKIMLSSFLSHYDLLPNIHELDWKGRAKAIEEGSFVTLSKCDTIGNI